MKLAHWQNRDIATHPLGAIVAVWTGRKGQLRTQQVTLKDGTEITPRLRKPWKETDEGTLREHGYEPCDDPPSIGFVMVDTEQKLWRVGGYREDGTRLLTHMPEGPAPQLQSKALTLCQMQEAGMTIVETQDERLEREGREHAERIEADLRAKEEAKAKHVSAAQIHKGQKRTGKLFG